MGSRRVENQACSPILPDRCELDSCRRGAWRSPSSPCWAWSSGSCSCPRAGACRSARRSSRAPRAVSRPPSPSRVARAAGAPVFRLELMATDPRVLARRGSGSSCRAARRAVRLRRSCGSAARSASSPPQADAIGIDEPTVFLRSPDCSRPETLPAGTGLDLAVEVEGPGDLALLGFRPLAGASPGPIQVPPLGARPHAARRAWRLRRLPGDGPPDRPPQLHVAPVCRDHLARGARVRRDRTGPRGLPRLPDGPLAPAPPLPPLAPGRAGGGGCRPSRAEPRAALRRPRAAAVRPGRAVSPARIRRARRGTNRSRRTP